MQAYLITAKTVKQSVANAKTYLAEKDIKISSSALYELLAKILFRKNYNDLIASTQECFDTPLNLSEVFVRFSDEVSLKKFKNLCQAIAEKASFDDSSIQEFQELQPNHFKLTIDNKKANKNVLTFLMLFQQICTEKGLNLSGLSRSSIRIETENLLLPAGLKTPVDDVANLKKDAYALKAVEELASTLLLRFKSHFNKEYAGVVEEITFAGYDEDGSFELWDESHRKRAIPMNVLCLFFNMLTADFPESAYQHSLKDVGRPKFDDKDLAFLTQLRQEFKEQMSEDIGQAVKSILYKKCKKSGLLKTGSEICTVWTKADGWAI